MNNPPEEERAIAEMIETDIRYAIEEKNTLREVPTLFEGLGDIDE